jgi:hypothetical protein
MRYLLLLSVLMPTVLMASEPTPATPTPATLTAAIQAEVQAGKLRWAAPLDIDGDGRPSRFEVIVACAKSSWLRRAFPESFGLLDLNRDNALDQNELRAFAGRESEARIAIEPRRRLVMGGRTPAALGVGGGAGGGLSVGRASVTFGGQQAYIADYDVVNGQYDPVIGILTYGTTLDVGDVTVTIHRR